MFRSWELGELVCQLTLCFCLAIRWVDFGTHCLRYSYAIVQKSITSDLNVLIYAKKFRSHQHIIFEILHLFFIDFFDNFSSMFLDSLMKCWCNFDRYLYWFVHVFRCWSCFDLLACSCASLLVEVNKLAPRFPRWSDAYLSRFTQFFSAICLCLEIRN